MGHINWWDDALAMIILRETLRYRHSDQLAAMEVPRNVIDELAQGVGCSVYSLECIMKERGYSVANGSFERRTVEYALNDKDFEK
jgi:hypothetical protein